MNDTLQQQPDGSWTPAVPIPYKPDTRNFWQRLGAVIALLWRKK